MLGAWQTEVTLADATEKILKAGVVGKDIYVTKITASIITHANAKKILVHDEDDVQIAAHTDLTAAAGVPSVVTWTFGARGLKVATNKDLIVNSESSGVAGIVYAEGYTRTA